MISLLLLLLTTIALGAPSREAMLRQGEVVEAAADRVAQARADGAPRRDVKDLMAAYRHEAETLAELQDALPPDDPFEERGAAVSALAQATAEDRDAPEARALLDAWLGDPTSRIALLEQALIQARSLRSPELARGILLDVEIQATVLMLMTGHDASLALADAAQARLGIASLEARSDGGVGADIEIRRLMDDARQAEERAEALRTLRETASGLRNRAQGDTP